jgi:hypothetical protein
MLQGIQLSRTNGRGLIARSHARRPADRIASLPTAPIAPASSRAHLPRAPHHGVRPGSWPREAARLDRSRWWSWWLWRGGPTRSLPEHGRETPQRLRYCVSNCVGQSAGARTTTLTPCWSTCHNGRSGAEALWTAQLSCAGTGRRRLRYVDNRRVVGSVTIC